MNIFFHGNSYSCPILQPQATQYHKICQMIQIMPCAVKQTPVVLDEAGLHIRSGFLILGTSALRKSIGPFYKKKSIFRGQRIYFERLHTFTIGTGGRSLVLLLLTAYDDWTSTPCRHSDNRKRGAKTSPEAKRKRRTVLLKEKSGFLIIPPCRQPFI